ncbi:MAG: efflux RND transporter periplasmic adaptor subunit [Anaerolineae bacterium]|nr:efflux RND transporter periplasmic adaptor subunit [Phycisphaerae bacterium]
MEAELHKLRIDKHERAKRNQRSVWPVVLLVILLLGGAAGAWQWRSASAAPVVKTMRVRVPEGAVSESDLVVLNATGYVMAAHKIELASKVVGRVAWVGVEMGDKIEKDQVLVRLEDDEYKARVAQEQGQLDNAKAKLAELVAGSRPQEIAQAKAALDQAQSDLTTAELSLKRMKDVEGANSVAKQQIDDAEGLVRSRQAMVESQKQSLDLAQAGPRKEQIDAQRATVRQIEGALALAQLDLNNTVIRSSIPATVLERNVEVGEFVTTGFVGDRGAKGYVVSIADLNDLRVELDISQNDFAKVVSKGPCWIVTDAYPDKKYQGVVDLISPEANRQKATVLVRVKVLNPDDLLKPDMNATVSFLSAKKLAATQSSSTDATAERPTLRIPSTAIRDGAVFVVEGGKAMKRTVVAGQTSTKGETEIRKGLIGGEDLIVFPSADLKDGDKVKAE